MKIETKFPAFNLIYSSTFEGVFNHRQITKLVFLLEIHFTILQLREAQNVSTMFSKKCQLFWYFRHQDLSRSDLPDILDVSENMWSARSFQCTRHAGITMLENQN